MAQKKSSRNCEGMCRKIYNAVSPLRATIRRISHQPQGSILSQATEKPAKVVSSSPLAKPVLHRPFRTKMIPIEFESSGRDKEIVIDNGQMQPNSGSRKIGLPQVEKAQPEKPASAEHKRPGQASLPRAKSKVDDDPSVHDKRFLEYIVKVKDRMIRAMSNVDHKKGA